MSQVVMKIRFYFLFPLLLLIVLSNHAFSQRSCADAVTITPGTHEVDGSIYNHWFKYTASKDVVLKLSSCDDYDDTYLAVFHVSCDEATSDIARDGCSSISEAVLHYVQIERGQTIYLDWECRSDAWSDCIFDVELTEITSYTCDKPKTAVAGANGYNAGKGNKQYYTYTAPETGSINLKSTGDADAFIGFHNGCDDNLYGHQGETDIDVTAGQTLLFHWRGGKKNEFNWYLTEHFPEPGSSCTKPVFIEKGDYDVDLSDSEQWFAYVADVDEDIDLLVCSEDYTTQFSTYINSCDTKTVDGLTLTAQCDYSADQTFALQAGDTLFIQWEQYNREEAFSFKILEHTLPLGTDCEYPIPVEKGVHSADNGDGDQWFQYVPSKDERIIISSCSSGEDTKIVLYKNNCSSFYTSNDDSDGCGYSSMIVTNLAEGDTLIFMWDDRYNSSAFTFDIEEMIPSTCSNISIIRTTAEQVFDQGAEQYQFYSYTAKINGILYVTDGDEYNDVGIGTDCSLISIDKSKSGDKQIAVTAGETYYIKWYSNGDNTFNWNFTEYTPTTGESCEDPVILTETATIGFDKSLETQEIFYSYTATTDEILQFDDGALLNSVYLYEYCTDAYSTSYNTSGNLEYQIDAGETIIIKWKNSSGQTFDWDFTATAAGEGDICSNPFMAITGTNTFEKNTPRATEYYSYTATLDGIIECETNSYNANCKIYSACDGTEVVTFNDDPKSWTATSGTTYIICWDNESSYTFSWDLTEREIQEGDVCQQPIELLSGEEITMGAASTSGRKRYFSYTPDVNENVVISDGTTYYDVTVYEGCGSYLSNSYRGDVSFGAEAGQTYIIEWIESIYDYTWTIEATEVENGAFCFAPIPVEIGTHTADNTYGDQWYEFTAKHKGNYQISSCDNGQSTELYLGVNSCSVSYQSNYGSGCTSGTVATKVLQQGDVLKIKWDDYYSTTAFEFSVTELIDTSCDEATVIAESGQIEYSELDTSTQMYTYTATVDGIIYITDNEALNSCNIYEVCGGQAIASSYNGEVKLDVTKGNTYIIKWNYDDSTSETWNLYEFEKAAGDYCTNPIEISIGSIPEKERIMYNYTTYYTYEADSEQIITVSDNSNNNSVDVKNYCGAYNSLVNSANGDASFHLDENESVIIEWTSNSDQPYTWDLIAETPAEGDICSNAITVSKGTIDFIDTLKNATTYYKYTSYGDYVEIFDNAENRLKVYTDCDSEPILIHNGSYSNFDAVQGQTYIFEWVNESEAPFTWEISEAILNTGDLCSMPIEMDMPQFYAMEKIKTGQTTYFSFNLGSRSRIELQADNADAPLKIYTACGEEPIYSAQGDFSFINEPGVEYIIEWGQNGIGYYTWEFDIKSLYVGDICTKPLSIAEGVYEVDNAIGDRWYKYTADKDISILVSACGTDEDTYLQFYKNDCGNYISYSDDYCGLASEQSIDLLDGEELIICWSNRYTPGVFEFRLIEIDCSGAQTVETGAHTTSLADGSNISKFNADENGTILISSYGLTDENTTLSLAKDDCDNVVDFNEDFNGEQAYIGHTVVAGSEYYITWYDYHSAESFNWEIIFIPEADVILDTDGDYIPDTVDLDDDNDGVLDSDDLFPVNPLESADADNDGIGDNADTDDDNDNVADIDDNCPNTAADQSVDEHGCSESALSDTDNDGIIDNIDTDDDNDGVDDILDHFPLDASETADNDEDGTGDNADTDDDNDGVADKDDLFPFDESEFADADLDGTGDNADTDDDNDGVADSDDDFPLDGSETTDTDGDGTGNNADLDDDNDQVADTDDLFPLDTTESTDADNDGIGDNADLDDDNDGVADINDNCPNSLIGVTVDKNGCSEAALADNDNDGIIDSEDADDDNDGVVDTEDVFPFDDSESKDTDGDGIGNNADADDDNDGVADSADDFPLDDSESMDTDGDGIGNNADLDDDNDGVADSIDRFPLDDSESKDTDGDGIGNNADADDDNDGVADSADVFPLDDSESIDIDGDGIGNNADLDDDNDGVADSIDRFPFDDSESKDTDGDGIGNNADADDDNDGVADSADDFPLDDSESIDTDGDGIGNNADLDDDNDGLDDVLDSDPLNPQVTTSVYNENGRTFTLSPNPATNTLNISYGAAQDVEIVVLNSVGIHVLSIKTSTSPIVVPIYSLPAGLYEVKLFSGNEVFSESFIKE